MHHFKNHPNHLTVSSSLIVGNVSVWKFSTQKPGLSGRDRLAQVQLPSRQSTSLKLYFASFTYAAMFCVLVGMLGGMLLGYASCFTGRSLSDPNCRLPRGPKSAPVSPQTNWVCWVSPPQEGKGSHQESNATVKTALVESTQHSSQLH